MSCKDRKQYVLRAIIGIMVRYHSPNDTHDIYARHQSVPVCTSYTVYRQFPKTLRMKPVLGDNFTYVYSLLFILLFVSIRI